MHTGYLESCCVLTVYGTEQTSSWAKCQLTATLCLQRKNLWRDQRLTTTSFTPCFSGVLHRNKNWKYIYIYSTAALLICSNHKDFKTSLGFRVHMLWIYWAARSLHALLQYKLQARLRFLSSLQLKPEQPSSCLRAVSWLQHISTKLGADLSGCPPARQTAWGKQGYRKWAFKPLRREEESSCL